MYLSSISMTYYILRSDKFDNAAIGSSERVIYLLKKRDVPGNQQADILHLKCNSIKRVSGISRLMMYLNMHTSDSLHIICPYIIRRLVWNEAVDLFGLDYDTGTSENETDSSYVNSVIYNS